MGVNSKVASPSSLRVHSGGALRSGDASHEGAKLSLLGILGYGFCYCAFFVPSSYAVPNAIYKAWIIWIIVVGFIATVLMLANYRVTLRWFGFAAFFVLYYLVSTFVSESDGSVSSACQLAIRGIGFASLLEYSLTRNRREAILGFLVAGILMCAVNYVTFLMYRDVSGGMRAGYVATEIGATRASTQNWFFFSHDNGTAFMYLPVLVVLWHYAFVYRSRKARVVAIAFSIATLYMYISLWSVTAMVVSAVTVAVLVYLEVGKKSRILGHLGLRPVFVACVVVGVAVVLLASTDFMSDAAAYFNKSGTFNSRVSIWSRSIDSIMENLIFGSGCETTVTTYLKIGINHCHNFAVQILYSGGIAAAVAFIVAFFACGKVDREWAVSRGAISLAVGMAAYFALGCFDWYAYMVIPMVLPYMYSFPVDETSTEASLDEETTKEKETAYAVGNGVRVRKGPRRA